jgi:hypothetical protein
MEGFIMPEVRVDICISDISSYLVISLEYNKVTTFGVIKKLYFFLFIN